MTRISSGWTRRSRVGRGSTCRGRRPESATCRVIREVTACACASSAARRRSSSRPGSVRACRVRRDAFTEARWPACSTKRWAPPPGRTVTSSWWQNSRSGTGRWCRSRPPAPWSQRWSPWTVARYEPTRKSKAVTVVCTPKPTTCSSRSCPNASATLAARSPKRQAMAHLPRRTGIPAAKRHGFHWPRNRLRCGGRIWGFAHAGAPLQAWARSGPWHVDPAKEPPAGTGVVRSSPCSLSVRWDGRLARSPAPCDRRCREPSSWRRCPPSHLPRPSRLARTRDP